jgi:hypothetical protein
LSGVFIAFFVRRFLPNISTGVRQHAMRLSLAIVFGTNCTLVKRE